MESENPENVKVPVINFSLESLKLETPEWDNLKAKVREALQEFGCFEAVIEKSLNWDNRKAFFEGFKELFELPLETKRLNVSDRPLRGYVDQNRPSLYYENFAIDDPNNFQQVETFVNTMWAHGKSSFCKTIQSYLEQVSELEQIVRRLILEILGVEKYLDEHMKSTEYLLRVMKYKGPKTTEAKLALMPHKDINFVTILDQYIVDGLEIQTKHGQWISVQPSLGSFVVLIGDSLYAWSNGRFHVPNHRVMMSGNEARYSAGLFSVPKPSFIVKTPQELVDQQNPLLFNPFDYIQFTKYLAESARRSEFADLKTYCGV